MEDLIGTGASASVGVSGSLWAIAGIIQNAAIGQNNSTEYTE